MDRALGYGPRGSRFESWAPCRGVAQFGRAGGLGPSGRRFESFRPDHDDGDQDDEEIQRTVSSFHGSTTTHPWKATIGWSQRTVNPSSCALRWGFDSLSMDYSFGLIYPVRVSTDQRICGGCETEKPVEEFPFRSPDRKTGKRYRRHQCRQCHNRSRAKYKTTADARRRSNRKSAEKQRRERANNERTDYYIWIDTRKSDRKAGRENDLTKEFIEDQISKGCFYCGEAEIRMTLDRIDNDIGHTQGNVVPCCIRCNYVRGAMPYAAWVLVAKSMREARMKNLFGEWTGRIR